MTYINNTIMLIEEEVTGNMSNKHDSKIQDKNIWKSLRTHILSRREKNKQAEADAEVLRKKKCVEYQKMQENKLSLAQINGRLSQLREKREELEEEKRQLLNQTQNNEDTVATALVVPKTEPNSETVNNKLVVTNNINNTVVSNHRSNTIVQQQQQHMFRQQQTTVTTVNSQTGSGLGSPAAGTGLSPLAQQSLMMHNSSTSNTGGSNQTLLVCSPATINAVVANNKNNAIRSTMSLAASLSSTMTFTKFSSLYSSNSTHLLAPNIGNSNKMGRTPSPQPQSIQQQNYQQQQIVVPFPAYKPMNTGGNSSNNLNSSATAPVVNNLNQPLSTAANNNYPSENSNRRGSREDTTQPFNRNVWINNNTNNSNKNTQPNVSNYGSFYQPTSTAVNYCVNNGMSSSSSSSLSSVNTVYSYSGPPPPPLSRTETSSSSNIMVSAAGEHGAQQLPKLTTSHPIHHAQHALSHPPMYMSPGIRNQTSNHTYHSKPPHNVYQDEKLVSPAPNFYQQQGNRNVHSSTTTVPSQPHQMNQKSHNIGYPMRHPSTASSVSQISPAIIQSSQHTSYTVPSSSTAGYSNKSPASIVSTADITRYQQPPPPPPPPMSRHE